MTFEEVKNHIETKIGLSDKIILLRYASDNSDKKGIDLIMKNTYCDYPTAKDIWSDFKHSHNSTDNNPIMKTVEERREQESKQKAQEDFLYRNNAECPYCHSKNTKKISGVSKAGSVAMWGIFAMGKVSKQWHCNNCKSDF